MYLQLWLWEYLTHKLRAFAQFAPLHLTWQAQLVANTSDSGQPKWRASSLAGNLSRGYSSMPLLSVNQNKFEISSKMNTRTMVDLEIAKIRSPDQKWCLEPGFNLMRPKMHYRYHSCTNKETMASKRDRERERDREDKSTDQGVFDRPCSEVPSEFAYCCAYLESDFGADLSIYTLWISLKLVVLES